MMEVKRVFLQKYFDCTFSNNINSDIISFKSISSVNTNYLILSHEIRANKGAEIIKL